MMTEWEKIESCWMNIGSPDFVQWQILKGYLEIQRQGLSHYGGLKKKRYAAVAERYIEAITTRRRDAYEICLAVNGQNK